MKSTILGSRLEFLFKELLAEAARSVAKREQVIEWAQALIDAIRKSPRPSRQD